jgi:hypothetical protein
MSKGKRISPKSSLKDMADYSQKRLALLRAENKRFENPHV